MAYTPQTWEDAPSTATPITAARLGVLEAGVAAAHAQATRLAERVTVLERPVHVPTLPIVVPIDVGTLPDAAFYDTFTTYADLAALQAAYAAPVGYEDDAGVFATAGAAVAPGLAITPDPASYGSYAVSTVTVLAPLAAAANAAWVRLRGRLRLPPAPVPALTGTAFQIAALAIYDLPDYGGPVFRVEYAGSANALVVSIGNHPESEVSVAAADGDLVELIGYAARPSGGGAERAVLWFGPVGAPVLRIDSPAAADPVAVPFNLLSWRVGYRTTEPEPIGIAGEVTYAVADASTPAPFGVTLPGGG